MNAKQLRQAADELSNDAARYFEEYLAEDHDDTVSFALFERIDLVTDHILATVREDDDELLSQDNWLDTIQHECELVIHYEHCRTRGDFRTLCRLLGVELKEPSTI